MGEPPAHSATHVTLAKTWNQQQRPTEWVQVPRASLEAMAKLIGDSPAAAQLLTTITGRMGMNNALIASQQTLAEITGLHLSSVKRAMKLLRDGRWITIVRIGKTGTVSAIVVNDRVAWFGPREKMRFSLFSATVIASEAEQENMEHLLNEAPMIEIPAIYRGEMQMPAGDGLPPPSEPPLPGFEPDLPARTLEDTELS